MVEGLLLAALYMFKVGVTAGSCDTLQAAALPSPGGTSNCLRVVTTWPHTMDQRPLQLQCAS